MALSNAPDTFSFNIVPKKTSPLFDIPFICQTKDRKKKYFPFSPISCSPS